MTNTKKILVAVLRMRNKDLYPEKLTFRYKGYMWTITCQTFRNIVSSNPSWWIYSWFSNKKQASNNQNVVWFHIYEMSKTGKSVETESRLEVA